MVTYDLQKLVIHHHHAKSMNIWFENDWVDYEVGLKDEHRTPWNWILNFKK